MYICLSSSLYLFFSLLLLLGASVVAVYVRQGFYMLCYWHRRKKFNVVEVMITKSGEETTPARLKFKPLLFQRKKFSFCL